MLWLLSRGIARGAAPHLLANVTPGDLISSLTTEAGVSFGPHHCKERAEAWRTELEISLSDKNCAVFRTTPPPVFETNLYAPNLSPKEKVLTQKCPGALCR